MQIKQKKKQQQKLKRNEISSMENKKWYGNLR
jgi:hypothetical protein